LVRAAVGVRFCCRPLFGLMLIIMQSYLFFSLAQIVLEGSQRGEKAFDTLSLVDVVLGRIFTRDELLFPGCS
jgi:hypothetical protein